jgi:hypothetical protein
MRRRFVLVFLAACSSSSSGGSASDAGAEGVADAAPSNPSFAVAPSCGKPGDKVGMKLARDNVPPTCVRIGDFVVQFTGAPLVQPDQVGLSSDGFCEVDLVVPQGTRTGPVTVRTGTTTFVSAAPFTSPCP